MITDILDAYDGGMGHHEDCNVKAFKDSLGMVHQFCAGHMHLELAALVLEFVGLQPNGEPQVPQGTRNRDDPGYNRFDDPGLTWTNQDGRPPGFNWSGQCLIYRDFVDKHVSSYHAFNQCDRAGLETCSSC
jgi:hypothetical protein